MREAEGGWAGQDGHDVGVGQFRFEPQGAGGDGGGDGVVVLVGDQLAQEVQGWDAGHVLAGQAMAAVCVEVVEKGCCRDALLVLLLLLVELLGGGGSCQVGCGWDTFEKLLRC